VGSSVSLENIFRTGISSRRAQRESIEKKEIPLQDTELTDVWAIENIRAGNVDALSLLFDRYNRSVYSIGVRILRDATEAQELVQDVFLHVCEKAHLFEDFEDKDKGTFASWLHHIAYRHALNRREYLNVRHFYDHLELEELTNAAHSQLCPESQTAVLQWRQALNAAMSELDERQRITLEMFFFEGYSLREISVRLDEALGNTRHHYYRGLKTLKTILKSSLGLRNMEYTHGK
jgi:RNA polymerase sigma-70 factor, ECF subfamily